MNSSSEKVKFIWSIVDVIRDQPARPLEIIEPDIKALEKKITARLREVAGE